MIRYDLAPPPEHQPLLLRELRAASRESGVSLYSLSVVVGPKRRVRIYHGDRLVRALRFKE